jgi:uncharacterized protein (TIGR03032 family)
VGEKIMEEPGEEKKEPVVGFVYSPAVYQLFKSLNISLLVSTYQAQRILLFSTGPERLSMLMRLFERPTGMAYDGKRLALCTKRQVWILEQTFNVRGEDGAVLPYDVVFVPRRSYVTGDIAAHEATWHRGELIFINTRFSCLATLSETFSFEPIWRPPFVTELAADDRCHLNGFAVDASGVRYATALGMTNEPEGWRADKRSGGVIMHVPSGELVARKLCMPHSPRLYAGKLWVLDSGQGELSVVDEKTGVRETVCRFPGYGRGLVFYDRYAFVGLSKIRESNMFGGLPIAERIAELLCAVCVVDITTGKIVGFIEFTKGIEELFDIVVIPEFSAPHIIGFDEDTIDGLYSLP